ncbi:hypothetical protein P4118_15145 [Pseudomonas aeruginosa]|nr:hypothetical protein [Pseudomonas aeruginosa]
MPQKKNPDVPELVRGKSGRVFGALTGLLTLMKGQPLAYNKDNQEDKEPLFDAADTLRDSLRAFADMVPAIRPRREIMREAARRGFSTATDLADYLVRKGLPFRDCHEIVGHAGEVRRRRRKGPRRDEPRRTAPLQRADRRRRLRCTDPGRLGQRPRPYRRHRAEPGPCRRRPRQKTAGTALKSRPVPGRSPCPTRDLITRRDRNALVDRQPL